MSIFTNFLGKKAQISPTSPNSSLENEVISILNQLTADVKSPNTLLIQEIVKTVNSDSKNPSVPIQNTIKKVKVGLDELLKEVSNPNTDLIDNLFALVVVSKSKEALTNLEQKEDGKNAEPVPKEMPSQSKSQEAPSEPKNNEESKPEKPVPSKPEPKQEKPKDDVLNSDSGQAMLGLMMDEIKELVVVSSKVNQKVTELEGKTNTTITQLQESQIASKKDIDEMKKKVEKLEKSIEKFIGLYEIITNMYNPFSASDSKNPGSSENKSEEKSSEKNFFDEQIDKQKELNKKLEK